jgi:hypothetical protein
LGNPDKGSKKEICNVGVMAMSILVSKKISIQIAAIISQKC